MQGDQGNSLGTLKKVGLFLRDEEQDYPLEELGTFFASRGISVVPLNQEKGDVGGLDLVLAMGGDGTVLRALDLFPRCPVLAINFGRVGFLTAGERKDLEQIIGLVMEGKFLVSERLVLDCRYPGGTLRVVNELMVRTISHLLYIDVFVNDTKIRTICGDGVVVGTPTGSTGFLLSTGGPIVMPDVRGMILDGINEHNFTSRALILTPESRICLHLSADTRSRDVVLIADGRQICQLDPGQEICISQAPHTAKLIYLEPNYFFHNLSSKLSW